MSQHHQLLVVFSTSFHDIMQGGDVGVKTDAHILDVVNDDIDIGELLVGGFFVGTVKRHQRQASFVVGAVSDVLPRICITSKPVFRCKNLDNIELQGQKRIYEMDVFNNRCLIGYYRDSLTDQGISEKMQAINAELWCGNARFLLRRLVGKTRQRNGVFFNDNCFGKLHGVGAEGRVGKDTTGCKQKCKQRHRCQNLCVFLDL